jgi:hypothetical protein
MEKSKATVKKQIPDVELIALKLTMLFTALQSSLYCIAEIEPHKLSGSLRVRYNNLRSSIVNFIKFNYLKSNKKDITIMEDKIFDKVAYFAELLPIITQVPSEKLEKYITDCKILAINIVKEIK